VSHSLTVHEDTFQAHFEPYRHSEAQHDIWGGLGLEAFGPDLELVHQVDPDHVWTVVDGDAGHDQWIVPGVHRVNRICYLVTRKPHHELDLSVAVRHRLTSLTPRGLQRQLTQLRRALEAHEAAATRLTRL